MSQAFKRRTILARAIAAAVTLAVPAIGYAQTPKKVTLLNVSYDPTRELYCSPSGPLRQIG